MKLAGNKFHRFCIMIVLVSFTQFSLISNIGNAAIVDSRMMVSKSNESETREISEKKIRTTLENKIVANRLKSYGLSEEQIYAKIRAMSDE